MRTIDKITDAEAHELYCIAVGRRNDLDYGLKITRGQNSIRIEKSKELLHLHYYRPSVNVLLGELTIRARNLEGLAATVQVVSVIRYLGNINVALSLNSKSEPIGEPHKQTAFAIVWPDSFVPLDSLRSTMFDVQLQFSRSKKHHPEGSKVGKVEIRVMPLVADELAATVAKEQSVEDWMAEDMAKLSDMGVDLNDLLD